MLPSCKIGVTDSGLGGLTVVRQLQMLLPGEDIVYFGDNKNCPYGNKDKDTLIDLASGMIDCLQQEGLKLVAVACNTTSALVSSFCTRFAFPIFGVIEPVAQSVAMQRLPAVGVLATMFTTQSKMYPQTIHRFAPNTLVFGQGSPTLAALVDGGCKDPAEAQSEVRMQMDALLAQSELSHVILGCTHYPILRAVFEALYPTVEFIDPAVEEAKAVQAYLTQNNLCNPQPMGSLHIYTTGDPQIYRTTCQILGMAPPNQITVLE